MPVLCRPGGAQEAGGGHGQDSDPNPPKGYSLPQSIMPRT